MKPGHLKKHAKDEIASSWHRAFKCTGIQHCQEAHPEIITPSPRFDQVTPSIFRYFQVQGAAPTRDKISMDFMASTQKSVIYLYQYIYIYVRNKI